MTATKFSCGVCSKAVANNHNELCCDSCDKWVHIKCNFLVKYWYKKLQKDNSPWFCINCNMDQLPFQSQANINQTQHFITSYRHCTLRELLENLDLQLRT